MSHRRAFRTSNTAPHRPARHALAIAPLSLGISICLALLTLFLGDAVSERQTLTADRHILRAVDDETAAWPLALSKAVSLFGTDPVVGAVMLIVVAVFLWRRRWLDAGFLAAAFLGSIALSLGVKHLVNRPRPTDFFRVAASGGSFPSGHTITAAAFALALAFLLWRTSWTRVGKIVGSIVLMGYAVCVGVSRLTLGVHYPTDVLGGILLGAAWVTLLIAIYSAVERRPSARDAGRAVAG